MLVAHPRTFDVRRACKEQVTATIRASRLRVRAHVVNVSIERLTKGCLCFVGS
jgi:hypothetical protein